MNIALDTNAFIRNDGTESADLRFVISRSRLLNMKIWMLKPVEMELIQKISEKIGAGISKLRQAATSLNDAYVDFAPPELDLQTEIAKSRSKLAQFRTTNGITLCDFPDNLPSVNELFEIAARKSPPFDSKGASFRDAIIWYSVLALAKGIGSEKLLFQTNDTDFRSRIADLAASISNLSVFSMEQLKAFLDDQREQVIKEIYKESGDAIKIFIESTLMSTIQQRINSSHIYDLDTIQPHRLGRSIRNVIKIKNFVPKGISKIDVIELKDGKVTFQALLDGELHFDAMVAEYDVVRMLSHNRVKAGEAVINSAYSEPFFSEPRVEEIANQFKFELEGVAGMSKEFSITHVDIKRFWEQGKNDVSPFLEAISKHGNSDTTNKSQHDVTGENQV